MFWPNLKSVASPFSEIAIRVLGGVCEPQSWGRRGSRGSRTDGTVRKSDSDRVPISPP